MEPILHSIQYYYWHYVNTTKLESIKVNDGLLWFPEYLCSVPKSRVSNNPHHDTIDLRLQHITWW